MDQKNTNKILIRKYINQQCNAEEIAELRRLMKLPGTKALFDEVLSENWSGKIEQSSDEQELNETLGRFYTKLDAQQIPAANVEERAAEPAIRRINWRKRLSYAAIWVVLIGFLAGYGVRYFTSSAKQADLVYQELVNPKGQRAKIALPDGSEVYLGAGSKLYYPKQFTDSSREVKLEGEAFFEVAKNPHKPFIIHTQTVRTTVLGTSFRVAAFVNTPIEVEVATGKVRVDDFAGSQQQSLAVLTPGQKLSYTHGRPVLGEIAVADVQQWKNARLVFDNKSVKDIAADLERWYDIHIDFQDQTKSREKISVVLQADMPLHKIMKVLASTAHFKFQIKDRNVTIK